jgi:tRNA A37 threonylcarbamoyladenosine dehydratase
MAVIGLGGVGSWAVEALARSGLGALTLVDFDDICLSNTNRQLHAHSQSVGQLKSRELKKRLLLINPDIKVSIVDDAYSRETEALVFEKPFDLVVDAIDFGLTKYDLILACRERRIPLVLSGAAGGRSDFSKIRVGDLAQSEEDPMLASLRKKLRRDAGFPRKGKMGLSCVYSVEKPKFFNKQGEITLEKPEAFKRPLDCSTGFGTITHVTGSFGFALSHLAIETLLKT